MKRQCCDVDHNATSSEKAPHNNTQVVVVVCGVAACWVVRERRTER